jgi:hypothetical protein
MMLVVAVSPPHGHQNATWLRLSLSHGPYSPPPSSSHRRKPKPPSLAELLRQDDLRVQNIQMTLLSAGDDDDNAADDEKVKKRPARSTTTALEHGPVVDVNVGSASSISTVLRTNLFFLCHHDYSVFFSV